MPKIWETKKGDHCIRRTVQEEEVIDHIFATKIETLNYIK